ncbi:RING-H2 finger protein ATL74 [Sorghum bicolor]|uniref:RING-H2 finger protein ATL74 n=1 Tax=Sorghum bicolor TaxID=4558 RepID=UPI000B4262B0|nr:RING-H2 finger protein ATL74 [Sorghum bicolor]|eukprot:XP_021317076.1 RING-H2 finger protein ATL74 [Sorghum bicolor]
MDMLDRSRSLTADEAMNMPERSLTTDEDMEMERFFLTFSNDNGGNNYFNSVVILNLLAQQLEVDFETVLGRVFGGGAYGDGGAVVVPASDAAVASLEKQAFHATAEGRRDSDSECGVTGCAICLEEFEDGEEVTVMPCSRGHAFHSGCITEWLGKSNTCPLCRHALPTDLDDGP